MQTFRDRFCFNPEYTLAVGVERECFTLNQKGDIAPLAPKIVPHFGNDPRFGHELSACQLEERTPPKFIGDVEAALWENDRILREFEAHLDFRRLYQEVAPDSMPLDVYPDQRGRYAEITRRMSREVLLAACQITGTHVHIGMPNHEVMLRVYNEVISHVPRLIKLGDHSDGKRLEIYRRVTPNWEPVSYPTWEAYEEVAVRLGFAEDPRRCWSLVRMSVHGTIEFRMFGSTPDIKKVVSWAELCRTLCHDVMGRVL